MIPPEPRAEIRRLFDAEHWRVGTIATHLGVHHATVQQAIERERFVRPGAQSRPRLLDPFKAVILVTLEPYPRRRATRSYWMLRDRGFTGSAVQLRRSVRTGRPTPPAEVYLRLDTRRGEQAHVDWANFGPIQIGRARRALACFVLVLSRSRAV
jgi:transposase